jgi:hypothetical protein
MSMEDIKNFVPVSVNLATAGPGRGAIALRSGLPMPVVFMRKSLKG